MRLTAIDPGTTHSAAIVLDTFEFKVVDKYYASNQDILDWLKDQLFPEHLAIEMVASYGMPVGASTFETVLWAGRFIEAAGVPHTLVYRKKRADVESVAMCLCKSNRAKDATIRQAIIDLYAPLGGGKTPQIGTKSKPGPLYGMKSHLWAALAVGLTWAISKREGENNDLRGIPSGLRSGDQATKEDAGQLQDDAHSFTGRTRRDQGE